MSFPLTISLGRLDEKESLLLPYLIKLFVTVNSINSEGKQKTFECKFEMTE